MESPSTAASHLSDLACLAEASQIGFDQARMVAYGELGSERIIAPSTIEVAMPTYDPHSKE